jgi:hypothetical protein
MYFVLGGAAWKHRYWLANSLPRKQERGTYLHLGRPLHRLLERARHDHQVELSATKGHAGLLMTGPESRALGLSDYRVFGFVD